MYNEKNKLGEKYQWRTGSKTAPAEPKRQASVGTRFGVQVDVGRRTLKVKAFDNNSVGPSRLASC